MLRKLLLTLTLITLGIVPEIQAQIRSVSPSVLRQEGATNDQTLCWSDLNNRWMPGDCGGGANALNDLTDVTITTPSTNNIIYYNGSGWVNATLLFSQISGTLSDGQIPASITRDTEIANFLSAASPPGTDNILVKTDGTGRAMQATGVTVSDTDQVTAPGGFVAGAQHGFIVGTETELTISGGDDAGDDLVLESTQSVTKGEIRIPELSDGCLEMATGVLTSTGVACGTGSGGSGTANYYEAFTTATSMTMTNAEHGFGHANLITQCFDNATPRNVIIPQNVSVDTSTFTVTVTFSPAETGVCVVNGSGGRSTGIDCSSPSTLTISTGAITLTANSCFLVDTESAAASDDLTAITCAATGDRFILRAFNGTRTVRLVDDDLNLNIPMNFFLDNTADTFEGLCTSTSTVVEVSRSNGGS